MARLLSTMLVVSLLAGTAAAFAWTERLKLVRSPIAAPEITKVFSPVCDCPKERAQIRFSLREAGEVSVSVVDAEGDVVRTLRRSEPVPAGPLTVAWDGRNDAGEVVPEGEYRPRVRLHGERRTIVLPNPIRVDTTPPEVLRADAAPQVFSPGGDGMNDKVSVRYAFDEPAHALLFVDGEQRVRSRFRRDRGKVDWFGVVDGKRVPAGVYELTLRAEDAAGNVSAPSPPLFVAVRYVTLAREEIRVPTGVRFGVRVESDAESVAWRFAGGTGTTEPGVLVLRAPRRPGAYTLFVEAGGRGDRATVVVEPRGR